MSNATATGWPSGSGNLGWGQEPTGMLMPGRVQGWPAGTQRAANPATQLLTQAVAYWDVANYRDGDRFLRNQGTGGELLDLRLGSSIVANSNDPLFLAPEDRGYVYSPGAVLTDRPLTVPDEVGLRIVGDLDVAVFLAATDWTPASSLGRRDLLYKGGNSSNFGYFFSVESAGTLRLGWSANGTAIVTASSTAAPTVADGDALWVRATLDVDNGAGQYEVKFYTAPSSDSPSWTQLGNTVTGSTGVTSIYASTSGLAVGNTFDGSANAAFPGKFYRAIVKDGIDGTTVLDVDCDAITSGSATSFTAVTNQTVTINRSTSGRKSVAVPSRSKGGSPVMLLGTDDYLEVQDNWQHGLLNLDAGQPLTVLGVIRQWANEPTRLNNVVMKRDQRNTVVGTGWNLRAAATSSRFEVSDSVTWLVAAHTLTPASPWGSLLPIAGVRNTSSRTIQASQSSASTSVADTTTSLNNTLAVRVGRISGSVNVDYSDFEFYAAAVWRRALTTAELTTLSNYFTGRVA